LLCPTWATTKIALAMPQYPFAVPAGMGFLRGGRSGISYKCQLPKTQSPLERKHQVQLQQTLYYHKRKVLQKDKMYGPQEKKIKTIIEILVIIIGAK
jgi:hypothetical protein